MSKTKAVYALATNDVEREMKVIQATWDIISRLDDNARGRVIEWLSRWRRDEVPSSSRDEDDF